MKFVWSTALLALLSLSTQAAAQSCQEIRFDRGTFGTTVAGVAPPESYLCYTMATGAGQTARLAVLQGNNVAFTVVGVSDARETLSYRTQARTYEIRVFQFFRSVTDEAFRLAVEVR